jgi:hypothetical protein
LEFCPSLELPELPELLLLELLLLERRPLPVLR